MKQAKALPPGAPAIRRASDYVLPRRKIHKRFVLKVLNSMRLNDSEWSREAVMLLHRAAEEQLYELIGSVP